MAGIYLHIPFCRKACVYCDFHFSTQLKNKPGIVEALCTELDLQKDYLGRERIDTIYFGGGTPSVLLADELHKILDQVQKHFVVAEGAEITLEANPDDLSPEKLKELAASPVNRLSIGIQSFNEEDLSWMNRSHNAVQAQQCVEDARQAGFENITIDLIYGIPGRGLKHWEEQLARAVQLEVPHISAYALTVEKETLLENWIRKGKVQALDDEEAERQFRRVSEVLGQNGYEHYEISNFAKPNWRAVHNSSYWQGEPYLGIGPSAHSFDGESRQWNVANNHLYRSAINSGELNFEKETLSLADRFNEKVMTSLRRIEGLNLDEVDRDFGADFTAYVLEEAGPMREEGRLELTNGHLMIPLQHRFFSDGIAASLFYI